MAVFGYARVSTREQNTARQIDALTAHGIGMDAIFTDRISGKDFNRPAWHELMATLREGDVLVVASLDRLGRNYAELLETWRHLTKHCKVTIEVLDMPLLCTSCKRSLTQTLIADIVLELLSYVAETEREAIRRRQREGIAAAKLRGVRFGAPRKPVSRDFAGVGRLWATGRISQRYAAKRLKVSRTTFMRWCMDSGIVKTHEM